MVRGGCLFVVENSRGEIMRYQQLTLTNRWFVVGILLLSVSLTACGLLSGGSDSGCDPDILNAIRIAPPASADDLTESCVKGFAPGNAQYRAAFTLDPADLAAFQASTRIDNWQTTLPANAVFRDEAAGITAFQYGKFGDGAIQEDILIDTANPQRYKIYFYRAFVD
jgi:hypothetical protein